MAFLVLWIISDMRRSSPRGKQRGFWGALIGAGAGLLGGMLANESRADESSTNREFQERMSNTAYQRGMRDMRLAGLNPMLAYSQGGASVPTGSMASFENVGASAMAGYQGYQQAEAQMQSSAAAAQQADTQAAVGVATVNKIEQEISNLKSTKDQVEATVKVLAEEYQNKIKEGWNLTDVGNKLRAEIDLLKKQVPLVGTQTFLTHAQEMLVKADTKLKGLDISAAQGLGNLGREAGQLKILVDILQMILSASTRR